MVVQSIILYSQAKFTKLIAVKNEEIRTDFGNISNLTQEYVSNIMNVVISKCNVNLIKKYIKKEKYILRKSINLDVVFSISSATGNILGSLITLSIYGYGGYKIIIGSMTFGELIAFQQYTGMLIGPCMKIIRSNTEVQKSKTSIKRIFSILDEPINIKQNNKGYRCFESFQGNIEFSEVEFSYSDENKVIDNLNLKFEKGKMIALVGSSGCGKSTIVKLLFRLWDIDKGNINIDNIPLEEYNLKSIRKNISIITQDLVLFDDTIFNNLISGSTRIHRERIIDICKKVDIYDFIVDLPNGYNTIVGEKGVKLSGGQKQKLAIARALLNNSKIIIFDEATSALDNISQKRILENIKEYLIDKTTIIIAHRLSTIEDSDKIYIIDKGKVIEEGTHEELVERRAHYYNFLNEKNLELNSLQC